MIQISQRRRKLRRPSASKIVRNDVMKIGFKVVGFRKTFFLADATKEKRVVSHNAILRKLTTQGSLY